jgi:hypothetical protein
MGGVELSSGRLPVVLDETSSEASFYSAVSVASDSHFRRLLVCQTAQLHDLLLHTPYMMPLTKRRTEVLPRADLGCGSKLPAYSTYLHRQPSWRQKKKLS